jgi:hypothetical protein
MLKRVIFIFFGYSSKLWDSALMYAQGVSFYGVNYQPLSHEDVWGSGGIALSFFTLALDEDAW